MKKMSERFLSTWPITESLALLALESFLGFKDPSNATAALLRLATFDSKGILDPDLHRRINSDEFIQQHAIEASLGGGQEIRCPESFIAAKDAYIQAGLPMGDAMNLNTYLPVS